MLKNMLLASAAAFVVLGSAASLTNMKAEITSGNSADAALSREAFDMQARLHEMRDEQVRQATLLSVQETAIRRLQRDLAQADKVALTEGAAPDAAADDAVGWSLGLDIPSVERAEQAAAYHVAWRRAKSLEQELTAMQDAYRLLERETAAQLAALKDETSHRIATLERDHGFAVARLREEIEQRDSSIVGLMHRIVSMQSGGASAAPALAARPAAEPPARKVLPPAAIIDEQAELPLAAPERRSDATVPAVDDALASEKAAVRPVDPATVGPTVADGAAAYHAGDYDRAFEIWRVLANNGSTQARFHLGALYYEGRGVERQLETAHLLLGMAADAGHEGAGALRDRVAADMQRAQLAQASR